MSDNAEDSPDTARPDIVGELSRPASSPFNRKDADLILRTCDQVDFYVHKPILCIASSGFEELINRPALPTQITESDGIPVIPVPEHSSIMDSLMRFCYPIKRPALSTLTEVRDVLDSATSYDVTLAIGALQNKLLTYAEEFGLQVYCIACRNNLEEVARAAAEFAVREPFWETYVPEIESITAGAYWKLLAYYWDNEKAKRRTKRQKSPQLHWRNLELRPSAPSTKPPSPAPSIASFPFDSSSDGDVLLRSSDGVQFRVHRIILATSSPFFKDMFSLPQEPTMDGLEALSTVPFTENADTLDALLRAIYPVDEPDLKLVQDIEHVMETAIKYDVTKGISIMKKKLISCANKEPIRVFMIACRNRLGDVAKAAAEASLRRPILYSFERGSMVLPIWDLVEISAGILHRLIEYQIRCTQVIEKEMSDLKWVKDDFAWKSKVFRVVNYPCETCCNAVLEMGEERYQVANWWKVFMEEIGGALRQRPCPAIIMEEAMMDRSLNVAAKCQKCFKDSIGTLRTFRGIVVQQLDRKLAEVQIDFSFSF
jgi:hypothetical protein